MLEFIKPTRSVYDDISREYSLLIYEGELKDGRPVEVQLVYPKRKECACFVRIDHKDILNFPNTELSKPKFLKKLINTKIEEYFEEQANYKPMPKSRQKTNKKKRGKNAKYK